MELQAEFLETALSRWAASSSPSSSSSSSSSSFSSSSFLFLHSLRAAVHAQQHATLAVEELRSLYREAVACVRKAGSFERNAQRQVMMRREQGNRVIQAVGGVGERTSPELWKNREANERVNVKRERKKEMKTT